MKKVYLAVPYTGMETHSFQKVNKAAAHLMNKGYAVYSPISMNHHIALQNELPTNWEFWEQMDYAFLSVCDELIVLTLPGWQKSRGVKAEIKFAIDNSIPQYYMDTQFLILPF